MERIVDMKNYIRSRQEKGKTQRQIYEDLVNHGYDQFAARGLIMMHWDFGDDNEEPDVQK